jgi:hypothetical protein
MVFFVPRLLAKYLDDDTRTYAVRRERIDILLRTKPELMTGRTKSELILERDKFEPVPERTKDELILERDRPEVVPIRSRE